MPPATGRRADTAGRAPGGPAVRRVVEEPGTGTGALAAGGPSSSRGATVTGRAPAGRRRGQEQGTDTAGLPRRRRAAATPIPRGPGRLLPAPVATETRERGSGYRLSYELNPKSRSPRNCLGLGSGYAWGFLLPAGLRAAGLLLGPESPGAEPRARASNPAQGSSRQATTRALSAQRSTASQVTAAQGRPRSRTSSSSRSLRMRGTLRTLY